MKSSTNSLDTSKIKVEQLPLPGFEVPLESPRENWIVSVQGNGGLRHKIKVSKKKR